MRAPSNKKAFLSNIFSDVIHSKDGTEISVRCPFCGKPGKSKMCIIVDSDVFHCWVCEEKGRGLSRLIKIIKPSKLEEYHARYASRKKKNNEEVEEEFKIELPSDFKLLMDGNKNDPNWKAVTRYALSRGFTKQTLWSFRIGYSNEFGWSRRLIIPSFSADGELNYLTGRSIDPENTFRYKNLSAPRNSLVFNELDINWASPLLIAEGPLDLVKVDMNKTCLLGSTLNKNSLLFEKIVENNTPVILVLDKDAVSKAIKIASELQEYSVQVKLNFPDGDNDLNDLDKDRIEQIISSAQQYDYRFKLKLKLGNFKL
jgi:hypothetical protein